MLGCTWKKRYEWLKIVFNIVRWFLQIITFALFKQINKSRDEINEKAKRYDCVYWKTKDVSFINSFFLGDSLFFILGQLYYSVRKKAYCEKLERTFKEVLLRQLQEDSFEGYLSTSERKRQLEEYPDTVYLTDESGEHGYYLDREKSRRNIAHDPRLRILHSAYLVEHPLVVDSLYGKWQQHLE